MSVNKDERGITASGGSASGGSAPGLPGPSGAPPGPSAPPRPAYTEPVPVTTLVARSGARLLVDPSAPEVAVTGATLRGQDVRSGDLFAALQGARVHGADFAADAIAAGAAAILTDEAGAERPAIADTDLPVLVHPEPRAALGEIAAWIYGEPSLTLNVLGITGTSGKTTTTYLVESGLHAAGHTTGLIGTVETRVSGERLASAFTTPEAPDLQALFALMVEQGVTHVPMEVSSHALSLGRVNGTRFTIGAFTNLSQDHLDFHRDMDEYFAAKALLFDGRSTSEVVVVDGDWGRRLVTPQTITIGTEAGVDAAWRSSDIVVAPTGEQTFTLHAPDGRTARASIPLPGEFNVANATLAAAILDTAGVPLETIVTGLASVEVPGRMERVALGQPFAAVVDYAHKPAAVTEALRALRARTDGRIITVLGCGGDRDTAKRPIMGEAAARGSELVIVTDDNPRSEDPGAIRAEMLRGARAVTAAEAGEIREIGDRREAIVAAVAAAGPGDVVLVAGKGHETGQNVAGVVHPFSDRDELEAAIRDRLEVSA